MSSFKNNFECEVILMSTKNTTACVVEIRTKFDLGGSWGLLLISLAEKA